MAVKKKTVADKKFNQFRTFVTKSVAPKVELLYPKLDQPYAWDLKSKSSQPVAENNPNGSYEISFVLDAENGEELLSQLKSHYDECIQNGYDGSEEYDGVFGLAKLEDGRFRFKAKRKAVSGQGNPMPAPDMVAANPAETVENRRISSGSKGAVKFSAFPSLNPKTGNSGISLYLQAVQVIEAKYPEEESSFDNMSGESDF